MSRQFFIADTHFGHKNIIEYENRPFNSVEEMAIAIIENWNKTIKQKDRIYILGDFALSNKKKIIELIKQLNGYKVFVLGNHDKCYSYAWWKGKVYSLYPTVEIVDGELWGVMTAGLKNLLSGEETAALMDYVCGQNSDGYGEGFEQRPIKTPDGEIYVSFWDSENYSMKLEQEMKNSSPDAVYSGPVMGGM